MKRCIALTAAVLAASVIAPAGPARAHGCNSEVVIFSGYSVDTPAGRQNRAVNSNAVGCNAHPELDETGFDGRIINPGAHYVNIRYLNPAGLTPETLPSLTAVVDGLAFENESWELIPNIPTTSTSGTYVYDSASRSLPPTASGCITASVFGPDDPSTEEDESAEPMSSATFHTLDPTNLEPCGPDREG